MSCVKTQGHTEVQVTECVTIDLENGKRLKDLLKELKA